MDFDGLIENCTPPPNRRGKHEGDFEQKFHEGAVMVAFAMHLLRTAGTQTVSIYPDGMHGRNFDFVGWLEKQGFAVEQRSGITAYGGTFLGGLGRRIIINPKSGQGDVVAELGTVTLTAECKGGIINTRHPGQRSKLYRGLCEAVGLLMATPSRGRQVAVSPFTEQTLKLAQRLAMRCAQAGIELALIKNRGEVIDVRPDWDAHEVCARQR